VLVCLSALGPGSREAPTRGHVGVAEALVVRGLAAARVRPWSPPTSELRNASHSISLPQVPKKTSSTNLNEHIMVPSITLETEHVMVTSFRVRTGTHGHESELVKDVLVSKSPSDYNPS
jgi:hypothetical protein